MEHLHPTDSSAHSSHNRHQHPWWMHLACVLPLLLLLAFALLGVSLPAWTIWAILLLCIAVMFLFMSGCSGHEGTHRHAQSAAAVTDQEEGLDVPTDDLIQITAKRRMENAVVIEGKLRRDPDTVYSELKKRFAGSDQTPILQEGESGRPVVILVPKNFLLPRIKNRSAWINFGLLLATILQLSKATYRKMVQNLWWATGYNILAIPLAAGVLYKAGILLSPAAGAVLMSVSTVIVAINARLLRVRRDDQAIH